MYEVHMYIFILPKKWQKSEELFAAFLKMLFLILLCIGWF